MKAINWNLKISHLISEDKLVILDSLKHWRLITLLISTKHSYSFLSDYEYESTNKSGRNGESAGVQVFCVTCFIRLLHC